MSNKNNDREMAPLVGGLPNCSGCRRSITNGRYLRCSRCNQHWDTVCANISESKLIDMSKEAKSIWICPECACNMRKGGDNTDTPVKMSAEAMASSNVTSRQETARSRGYCMEDSEMSLDMSEVPEDDSVVLEESSRVEARDYNVPSAGGDAILRELRLLRQEVRDQLQATGVRIDSLRESMLQLSDRMARCEKHIYGMDERMKVLEAQWSQESEARAARFHGIEERLEAVERRQAEEAPQAASETVAQLERTVSELRLELNDRDQEALLADLDIGLLPEDKGENILHSIIVLAGRLGVPLEERDVVFVERVGPPPSESNRPRRVIVRLARRHLRDELLRAARTRRSVTAEGGGRLFINERLTRQNRQLFHRVREECRKQEWRYSWTRRGRIFARKADGAQVYQLRSVEDVSRVFCAA